MRKFGSNSCSCACLLALSSFSPPSTSTQKVAQRRHVCWDFIYIFRSSGKARTLLFYLVKYIRIIILTSSLQSRSAPSRHTLDFLLRSRKALRISSKLPPLPTKMASPSLGLVPLVVTVSHIIWHSGRRNTPDYHTNISTFNTHKLKIPGLVCRTVLPSFMPAPENGPGSREFR